MVTQHKQESLKEYLLYDSEKDLSQVASKVLTSAQINAIDQLIAKWREENPESIRVEKIRLADFSKYAIPNEKKTSLSFFVDTASAVQAVDQMVLVANRGIFLAQQLPFIVRLHARLGTQEILSDTISSLQSVPEAVHELNKTNSLVENLTTLVQQSDKLANDSKTL